MICLAAISLAPEVQAQGGSISGVVFNDSNNDGEATGETAEPGTEVELIDSNGNVVGTAVTGDDGRYLFENVPPGNYTLRFTYPNGFSASTGVFEVVDGQLIPVDVPVVDDLAPWSGVSPNLSVVNPASVRGPGVSPFVP